jgi:serine/threonine protein kinase
MISEGGFIAVLAVGSLVALSIASFVAVKLRVFLKDRAQQTSLRTWRASYISALRGNLVRTLTEPIENHYEIEWDRELGKGGCGIVVVGTQRDDKVVYAVKVVVKANTERGRLDRELRLLKDVDHTNVVRLFRVYDLPTHVFFVMELCSGGHLGNLIARQPRKCLDEQWARALAQQLISAVAHIHSRGICHRDIKLQNILMDQMDNDREAQVKLIDFGYGSRFIGSLPMKTKCGTPYTTAPEGKGGDVNYGTENMPVIIFCRKCVPFTPLFFFCRLSSLTFGLF